MMTFYIILCILALYAECSNHIDTTNLFKKIALGIIIIGCILAISGVPNNLIQYAVLPYVGADIWRKYKEYKDWHLNHD